MDYEELKAYMHEYRMERMTGYEMICAIHVWQRGNNG